MADLKALRLSTGYTELKKAVENQSYSKIVRICNKLLNEFDSEVKAWQCKLAALIQLGNFREGLQSLKKCKCAPELLFEKAYCEYRLNEPEEAWKTVGKCGKNSPVKIRELQAQILYRLERYEECYEIYRDLIKTTSDHFDQERLTNLGAVAVGRAYDGVTDLCPVPANDSSYEHLYNYGCSQIASNDVKSALKTLTKAEAHCRKILTQEDGASEEEVLEEVAIIRAQQGYCLQYLGREKEALDLYNNILKNKPDDVALLAIINNSIVAINREGNVFDSKKRMKATIAPDLEHKLTSRQKGAIALNRCLMGFLTHQDDVCEAEIAQLKAKYSVYDVQATIIKAALLGRLKKITELTKLLKTYAEQNPDDALEITLSAAQILLSNGEKDKTLEILLSLRDEDKFKPGIISSIVTLCCDVGKEDKASKLLARALEWHKGSNNKSPALSQLWQNAANLQLRRGDANTAIESLEALREEKPDDINVLAQLIQAYSEVDKEKAQELSKLLPSAVSMLKTVDVESLESSFSIKYTKKSKILDRENVSPIENVTSEEVERSSAKKSKRKKKRKVRLPKEMLEGVEPDPERWMPRWQRKGYKTRRNRRYKEIGTGTQGMGISGEAMDKYDITKTSHAKPAQYVPNTKTETGAKRQQWKKPVGKKKKR